MMKKLTEIIYDKVIKEQMSVEETIKYILELKVEIDEIKQKKC